MSNYTPRTMKKLLLIAMLKQAYANQLSKHILNLYIQIEQDDSLKENVAVDDFSNEFYSVRDIRWIKQCFDFKIF